MVLVITRLLFILALAAVAYGTADALEIQHFHALLGAILLSIAIIAIDVAARRKSIASISAIFFGLIAGLVTSLLLGQVVSYITIIPWMNKNLQQPLTLIGTVILCYVFISVIMQTKNDYRFIIPYVEFMPDKKGSRPVLLDTSAIIDGRIADLCETGLFDSQIVLPRMVLQELQNIADSADRLKRNRGRRGLDILNRLQSNRRISISILDRSALSAETAAEDGHEVDARLVTMAAELGGRIITVDYNLNKVAQFRGVPVININDLANALKPAVLPGEMMNVGIVKHGEAAGQGVGYLEDGTMVVVENARELVGREVRLSVTSVLQTSAGRMIFGRLDRGSDHAAGRSSRKNGSGARGESSSDAPAPPSSGSGADSNATTADD